MLTFTQNNNFCGFANFFNQKYRMHDKKLQTYMCPHMDIETHSEKCEMFWDLVFFCFVSSEFCFHISVF